MSGKPLLRPRLTNDAFPTLFTCNSDGIPETFHFERGRNIDVKHNAVDHDVFIYDFSDFKSQL